MKIPSDKQTRQYEVTYLVLPSLTETELASLKAQIGKLVTKHKGSVLSTQDWGSKKLAYKIRHKGIYQDHAYFVHCIVEFDPQKAAQFDKELQLHAEVIRHLMIKLDKPADLSAQTENTLKDETQEENSDPAEKK